MTEPVFESARLTMHHWTREDGEAFFRIWGDPRVVFWGGHAQSAADCVAAIERLRLRCSDMPGLGWFMVRERDGESVANVVLQTAAFAPGEVEVGWHVEHASWGCGYATEAAHAALRYAVLRTRRCVTPSRSSPWTRSLRPSCRRTSDHCAWPRSSTCAPRVTSCTRS